MSPPPSEGVVDEGGAVENKSGRADESVGLPFPRALIAAHLEESRDALRRAREKRIDEAGDDGVCEALVRAAARLDELAADFSRAARPDAERLENSLADLESLIDRALRASLPAEVVSETR